MADVTHGYNTSVEYSLTFFREMAPGWIDLCARIGGYAAAQRKAKAARYLELGCGQGLGLCILAATNPSVEFVGVDLQPEHIAHGEALAQAAALTNVRFVEGDFVELARDWPKDFGQFDYVTLHGVLNWISDAVREAVVGCVAHAIRGGSRVYTGYSAQPGWISTVPFQHVTKMLKGQYTSAQQVRSEAIALFDQLAAAKAPIFEQLPTLQSRVDAVRQKDDNYFVHEYLNDSWRPLWHSEVAAQFATAALQFVGSATMGDTLMPEILHPSFRELIGEQPTRQLREDLQDLVINQGFRRDCFVRADVAPMRGGLESTPETLLYLVADLPAGHTITLDTSFGTVTIDYKDWAATADMLAGGARTIAELLALPEAPAMGQERLIALLLHAGVLAPAAAEPAPSEAAERLNAIIAERAVSGIPYQHVAAAALGSGIHLGPEEMAQLDGHFRGSTKGQDARFNEATLPRYRRLGIVA